jgi:2',3'-cyclic-nucleotide 2'-phosphodiesterase/3'-nucleotidase
VAFLTWLGRIKASPGHLTGVEEDESRIVARLPEIRNILYDYLMANGTLDPYSFGSILGSWQFVPEKARKQAAADLKLLFP